ncbi:hypothetical protein H6G72_08125 [Planktothricoides sp. FACHB-1370]|uniref:Uncharacterized protein n=2 Tax=Planktothricoides raciborskii TaxID=132608 RepID=A0ABR8EAD9_9CYAN|nr:MULTISPECIES: hypothetical protein [Planktothricoides]MBD2543814.1 hypothetical protein [Planktothricoides raciborskii FACHB-1370]MBD2583097.1 hypothetical protein [Planktothricoides raciborskii FACHB-1261]
MLAADGLTDGLINLAADKIAIASHTNPRPFDFAARMRHRPETLFALTTKKLKETGFLC